MSSSSDAADQVIRMSLESVEIIAKISGKGAERALALICATLQSNEKTKGKTRLSNMLKTNKELKIFSVKEKDLKKFAEEAKRYGILYCVLAPKTKNDSDGIVDIMVKAEDAPRINRVVERFKLFEVDDLVIKEIQENKLNTPKERNLQDKETNKIIEDFSSNMEKSDKKNQLENSLEKKNTKTIINSSKRSVRQELKEIKQELKNNNTKVKEKVLEKRERSK